MQYIFGGLKESENKYCTFKNIVADSLMGGGVIERYGTLYTPGESCVLLK